LFRLEFAIAPVCIAGMRLSVLITAAVLSLAGAASAKVIGPAEAKSTFFGLDMGGVFQPDGSPWRECISPNGQTRYWFDGYNDIGKLTIRNDGALCFSYAKTDYKRVGCYTAEKQGNGWRFTSVEDPSAVFVAQQAVKTKACSDSPSA
jgi:hypothetical protein